MPENILQTIQKFFAISERLELEIGRVARLEEVVERDLNRLEERLRVAEGKIIALETALSSQRESVRETVRDTIRAEIAEERARRAEAATRRLTPALEEGR
jgi:hypothetical protein